MDFLLRRGQKCLIRVSDRETEAVKIAVSNLKTDLEKALGVSAEIVTTVVPVQEKYVTTGVHVQEEYTVTNTQAQKAQVPEIIIYTKEMSEEWGNPVELSDIQDADGN